MATIPKWLSIAFTKIGQYEVAGSGYNPWILECLRSVKVVGESDEVPWCSAAINWCMEQAGKRGTGLANARSWLLWGVGLDTPRLGAVCVLARGTEAWMGHVGLYLDSHNGMIALLGGNQSDRFGIGMYSVTGLLGYRWPKT